MRIIKIISIFFGSILLIMFLLPFLFPDQVTSKIKEWAGSSITGELNFSKARLSFFKHFPSLTLTLYDITLKGSKPFQQDILVAGDEVALGVNLSSVFSRTIYIDKIILTNGYVNIQVDSSGNSNYNVYKSSTDTIRKQSASDSSSASLKLDKIVIENSKLIYNDRSIPMAINAKGFNYTGKGDLDKAVFDLYSTVSIDSLDFNYGAQDYVQSKKIQADLVTKINTRSLALVFEKNNLKINRLPITFSGKLEFLPNGYDIDVNLKSIETDLHDMLTALPSVVNRWLEHTEVKGFGDINAELKGKYIVATNEMPDLKVDVKVRDGFIANNKTASPIKNLYMDLQSRLPGFNTDSLYLNIDSVFFNLDKDYVSSITQLRGLNQPYIKTKTNADIDLEKLDKAFGFSSFDVKGRYNFHLQAEGNYSTSIVKSGLRKVDTIISSIPSFKLSSSIVNGYLKYTSLPQAVNDISFTLNASCPDNNFRNTSFSIENLNARVINNFIKGFVKIGGGADFPINSRLQAVLHLEDVKKFYPVDSLEVAGDLDVDITSQGNYNQEKMIFPVTKSSLKLSNGSVQTKYYPHPVNDIQVSANVMNTSGSYSDLKIFLSPMSFKFEGQPFLLKAGLENFGNLKYDIISKGTLDIGKIYKVFAIKGYTVEGLIQTDLALRGKQRDALVGRFEMLRNSGTMKLQDVSVSSDLFPKPLKISSGDFRFEQDKMWFDSFRASYGKSNFTLKGYLLGLINYLANQSKSLQGKFELSSEYVLVDELMAFNVGVTAPKDSIADSSEKGVVIVPVDLNFSLNATVKKVEYIGLDVRDFKGEVIIDSGKLKLNNTGFVLIGAPVVMNAVYQSISPRRASFNYQIDAKDFDVKRAYQEIKLFRDMASAAENAEGIVSLKYQLNGKLNENMEPVYPSLKGGGTLSVKQVKVKGLKLFNAVSKETGKDISDPDLSKVDIKSSINNNIITIEKTKMRIAGFRPRFEGQVGFDGKLNLRFRLGLPPLGIVGIPLSVTGTQQNPIVKVRKGNDKDELEEKEDVDEQ